jgi:hypothetical protein
MKAAVVGVRREGSPERYRERGARATFSLVKPSNTGHRQHKEVAFIWITEAKKE